MRVLVRSSDLRLRPQKPSLGPALPDLRERSLPNVPAAHIEGFVVRATSYETGNVCAGICEGKVCTRVAGSLRGSGDPRVDGTPDCNHFPLTLHIFMETDNLQLLTPEQRDALEDSLAEFLLFLIYESDIELDQPDSAL